MAEKARSKLKIAMFPWFAVGHFTPYMYLSNKLAEKGHQISFLLPNKARNQLNHLNLHLHPNLINFYPLTVPQVEGLPPGTETASDVPVHLHNLLAAAMDLMQDQVKELLQKLNPNLVFYDFAYWIPELASEIGFKTVIFNVVCSASAAYSIVPSRKDSKNSRALITAEELMHPPPGFPSSIITYSKREAKQRQTLLNLEFGKGITFYDRIKTGFVKSDVISYRTCRELEGPFCDFLSKEYNRPVFLTGSLLPEPGKQVLEDRWAAKWLNEFEPGTVVFCAFGSQTFLEKEQFQEMVLGFELTGKPFFLVLKPPIGAATVEEALPEGFQDRTRGKGIVYGGWLQSPLPAVLKHPSVGCFVHHCGYGSMWESLMSDTQIVLIPQLSDQKVNTRLLAAEFRVAIEVEEDQTGWISKENLCKAINSVMDEDSEIRGVVKDNHTKLREIISNPSFTSDYADRFIQSLNDLCGPFAPHTT